MHNKPRQGRPRKTTKNIDRIIRRQSVADPQKTEWQINADMRENCGIDIHVSTVKHRLKEQDLVSHCPCKKHKFTK